MKFPLSALALFLAFQTFAQGDSLVVPLWKNGAPDFETKKNILEKGPVYVSNINNPSVTVFLPPKNKATGAAVVICPGGGHRMLVMTSEGFAPARFLNSIAVAAIVLKYRLGRDTLTPYYKIEVHGRQDGNRAMRLVRSHATEWGIDPNRIGIWGFSAGGEIVNMVAYDNTPPNPFAADPVDRLSSIPNFVIETYPGPLFLPQKVKKDAPPAFLVAANDDECCSLPLIELLQAYRLVGAHAELHIFGKGNHAFNMGARSELRSLKSWPQLLANWFADYNYFKTKENPLNPPVGIKSVNPKNAKDHIGEVVNLEGRFYGGELKNDPDNPGKKAEFLYIGGGFYPDNKITIILKNVEHEDLSWFNAHNAQNKINRGGINDNYLSIIGRLFIYEGKPTIEMNGTKEIGVASFKDNVNPSPDLQ